MKIFEFDIKNRNPQDPYLIPAVIYGHQVKESISCAINKRDFVKLVKTNTRNIKDYRYKIAGYDFYE